MTGHMGGWIGPPEGEDRALLGVRQWVARTIAMLSYPVQSRALRVCMVVGHAVEGRVDRDHGVCVGRCARCGMGAITDGTGD